MRIWGLCDVGSTAFQERPELTSIIWMTLSRRSRLPTTMSLEAHMPSSRTLSKLCQSRLDARLPEKELTPPT